MDTKRILLAGMVLVLTGACAWGATEISGFTAVPESEAAQIVGGDGYVCDTQHPLWLEERHDCFPNGDNPPTGCGTGSWDYLIPRYGCVPAESGECPLYNLTVYEWGDCGWNAETGQCVGSSFYSEYGSYCA